MTDPARAAARALNLATGFIADTERTAAIIRRHYAERDRLLERAVDVLWRLNKWKSCADPEALAVLADAAAMGIGQNNAARSSADSR